MSLVPGAIIASLVDFFTPHLTSMGFLYSFIGGMILYILNAHILSSLLGKKELKRKENDSFSPLRTRLY